ncbi:hypothetical protein IPZ58_07665 [Streptomyces roseoverticillatus]|uniref:WDGH domain-containing protein n=1 Tax=Streptomyces roseoverticillatus TaxID=66429 RepID=UPI001F3F75DB|nr:hypothetical protein [Streptomyces roseoverticillatus]MCF3101457.1 hypothetical protein [Streptomyces roseoverticillatus]
MTTSETPAPDSSDTPARRGPDTVRTAPDLRDQYATALYDTYGQQDRDRSYRIADTVLAVRDREMEQLRADAQKWADLSADTERTRRLHKDDADQYEECLRQQLAAAETERDAVYRERARLIAHLAALHPSHIGHTDPNAPEWAVVIVESPAGQLSWHIAERDMDLFAHVQPTNRICRGWDGHTVNKKYERMQALTEAPHVSALEQLPPRILALLDLPPYLSTACETAAACARASQEHLLMVPSLLARHLHERCRLTHKFTGQPCTCPCHQEGSRE